MSVSLPNGATISLGATYGVLKSMTAISNAVEAVATLEASHGVIVNDIVRIKSGWSKLNDRVARIKTLSTNDATFEGINTVDLTKYPALGGVGQVQEVLTWQQITQVLEAATSGGEQQFTTYSFLEDATERQIPTNKSAISIALTIADDPLLAHYAVLDAADEDTLPRVVRISLPNGTKLYYNAYVTLNKTPTIVKNEVMGLQVTISLVSDPTRYAT